MKNSNEEDAKELENQQIVEEQQQQISLGAAGDLLNVLNRDDSHS